MSALIPSEQRNAILLDGECVEDVDKYKYLGSNTIKIPKKIRKKSNPLRILSSAALILGVACYIVSYKGRVYEAVARSILLYGCNTRLVRVTDEMVLAVSDSDSFHRILYVRRRGCVPMAELRRRLCLTSITAQLVRRRFRWFERR